MLPVWAESPDPACLVDELARVQWSNWAMQSLVGCSGRIPRELFIRRTSREDRERLWELLRSRPHGESEPLVLLLRDDSELRVTVQAALLGPEVHLLAVRPVDGGEQPPGRRGRIQQLEEALSSISQRLAELGIGLGAGNDGRRALPNTLTKRQFEIAELLLTGLNEAEIAEALFISEHTVRNHKKAAFAALNVHSMAELLGTYRPTARIDAA